MPETTLVGIITSRSPDKGFAFVKPTDGTQVKDVFISPPAMDEWPDAIYGDIVEVSYGPSRKKEGKYDGRIMRVIEHGIKQLVGEFKTISGHSVVQPLDSRIPFSLVIAKGKELGAAEGQLVVAEIVSYQQDKAPMTGAVVEILGETDRPDVESLAIVRSHKLPDEFSADALAEADLISQDVTPQQAAGRTDLRQKRLVTIDGETSRDFDDAVLVERTSDGYRLYVAIADVSAYVAPGSALDRDAYERGTSVYFPDRCIPMLPEKLSNGICSLNPGVERLAFCCEMEFDNDGNRTGTSIYEAVIRSSARLTYTTVARLIEDGDETVTNELGEIAVDLDGAKHLAETLRKRRFERGSIDFDLPEPQIHYDANGTIDRIVKGERNNAHRLIEEFMLAANEAVACFAVERDCPLLFRLHEHPDQEKLHDFSLLLSSFGHALKMKEGKVTPKNLQLAIDVVRGRPEERLVNEVLLRSMKAAYYGRENLGHYGLASDCYAHFTSPIRRYPDLIVHRILKRLISGTVCGEERTALSAELDEQGAATSERERAAMLAERDIVKLRKCQFMEQFVGAAMPGHVSGVTQNGFFVELDDAYVEGMVSLETLPACEWHYNDKRHTLSSNKGTRFTIGDAVTVKVLGVNKQKRQIDFALAE